MTNLFVDPSDEDYIETSADNDEHGPVIFTSDDEHEPALLHLMTGISAESVDAEEEDDGQPMSLSQTPVSSKDGDPPAKKPKLTGALSLVSYTIDDDDDDDENQLPSSEHEETEDEVSFFETNKDKSTADVAVRDVFVDAVRVSTAQPQIGDVLQLPAVPIPSEESPYHFSTYLEEDPQQPVAPLFPAPINLDPYLVSSQDQIQGDIGNLGDASPHSATFVPDMYSPTNQFPDQVPTDVRETLTERLMREVTLPTEPAGLCRMELQEKIDREVRRMRLDISYDPNRAIQDNKSFRNPSIYEKLIAFLNIDEKGTNFPPAVYNPYRWSPQSCYDELARVQNREIDRITKLQKEQLQREQQQKQQKKMDARQLAVDGAIGSGNSVLTGYTEPKKKSKWDAAAAAAAAGKEGEADTAALVPAKEKALNEEPVKPALLAVGSLIKRR